MTESCDDGHIFLGTDPPTCIDCSVTLTKYDLIRTRGDGKVFIIGTLNDGERSQFDKTLGRGKLKQLEHIMEQAFLRLGYDIKDEERQLHLHRPF